MAISMSEGYRILVNVSVQRCAFGIVKRIVLVCVVGLVGLEGGVFIKHLSCLLVNKQFLFLPVAKCKDIFCRTLFIKTIMLFLSSADLFKLTFIKIYFEDHSQSV